MLRLALGCLMLVVAVCLPACSQDVRGMVVHNHTDRVVRAELIQVTNTGDMSVYSTQTLVPGGEFRNKVSAEDRRPGMRVRFSLPGAGPAAGSMGGADGSVLLSVPEMDREYDLLLVGDRLSAKDLNKPYKPKK